MRLFLGEATGVAPLMEPLRECVVPIDAKLCAMLTRAVLMLGVGGFLPQLDVLDGGDRWGVLSRFP